MSLSTIVITAFSVLALVLAWRVHYWYKQSQKLQQDGYLPPHPTFFGQWALRAISKLACRVFIGPVKVIDRKNARFDGRLNILPNHQFPLDFMVVGKSLPFGWRHLGTASEMSGPIRGTLAAFAGFFAVHTEGGKATGGGEAAVDALARVLAQDKRTRLLMFPQGKLVKDNVLRPEDFRTGAIRAMNRACDEYGVEPNRIAVLPLAIHYLRDRRNATWMHRAMQSLWKGFRTFKYGGEKTTNYGAVVVVGKPIVLSSLPEDAREATETIRQEMDQLLARAKQWEADRLAR